MSSFNPQVENSKNSVNSTLNIRSSYRFKINSRDNIINPTICNKHIVNASEGKTHEMPTLIQGGEKQDGSLLLDIKLIPAKVKIKYDAKELAFLKPVNKQLLSCVKAKPQLYDYTIEKLVLKNVATNSNTMACETIDVSKDAIVVEVSDMEEEENEETDPMDVEEDEKQPCNDSISYKNSFQLHHNSVSWSSTNQQSDIFKASHQPLFAKNLQKTTTHFSNAPKLENREEETLNQLAPQANETQFSTIFKETKVKSEMDTCKLVDSTMIVDANASLSNALSTDMDTISQPIDSNVHRQVNRMKSMNNCNQGSNNKYGSWACVSTKEMATMPTGVKDTIQRKTKSFIWPLKNAAQDSGYLRKNNSCEENVKTFFAPTEEQTGHAKDNAIATTKTSQAIFNWKQDSIGNTNGKGNWSKGVELNSNEQKKCSIQPNDNGDQKGTMREKNIQLDAKPSTRCREVSKEKLSCLPSSSQAHRPDDITGPFQECKDVHKVFVPSKCDAKVPGSVSNNTSPIREDKAKPNLSKINPKAYLAQQKLNAYLAQRKLLEKEKQAARSTPSDRYAHVKRILSDHLSQIQHETRNSNPQSGSDARKRELNECVLSSNKRHKVTELKKNAPKTTQQMRTKKHRKKKKKKSFYCNQSWVRRTTITGKDIFVNVHDSPTMNSVNTSMRKTKSKKYQPNNNQLLDKESKKEITNSSCDKHTSADKLAKSEKQREIVVAQLQNELNSTKSMNHELKCNVDRMNETLAELQQKLKDSVESKATISQLQIKVDLLTKSMSDVTSKHNDQAETFRSKLTHLKQNLNRMESERNSAQAKTLLLEQHIAKKSQEVQRLHQQAEVMSKYVSGAENQAFRLQTKLQKERSRRSDMERNADMIKSKIVEAANKTNHWNQAISDRVNMLDEKLRLVEKKKVFLESIFVRHKEKLVAKRCVICFENEIAVVFVPCGHRTVCTSCGEKLSKCPICRHPIEMKIKTFDG